MTFRTWGRLLLAALGAGALAGAGQLGFAYGLGIVRFARAFEAAARNQWAAQLTWVAWFAMLAAVVGAVAADRLVRRHDQPVTLAGNLAMAGAAALGAAAVVPLSMLPAHGAQVAAADPVSLAGWSAGLGAAVGALAALAALLARPVSWNVAAVSGGVWSLALLSVLPSLGPDDPLPAVRLGALDAAWLSGGTAQRLAVVTMPAVALVAGAVTGGLARRRGQPVAFVVGIGAAGPAMLAVAYLIAGSGSPANSYQAAPYWGSLIAAGMGVLGSGLAAAVRWPLIPERRASDGVPGREPDGSSVSTLPEVTGGPQHSATAWQPFSATSRLAGQNDEPAHDEQPDQPEQRKGTGASAGQAGAEQQEHPAASSLSRWRGLFRRRRSTGEAQRAPAGDAGPSPAPTPPDRDPRRRSQVSDEVPAHDTAYVEWVSGLSNSDSVAAGKDDRTMRRNRRTSRRERAE